MLELSSQRKIQEAFLEMLQWFSKLSTDVWFVEAGTLLGLYREKRILPWDLDADFGILAEHFKPEMIDQVISETNFSLYTTHGTIDLGYEIRFIHSNGVKVDWFLFYRKGDKRYCSAYTQGGKKDMSDMFAMPFDHNLIEKREHITVDIDGTRYNIPTPYDTEAYLQARYGEWRVPNKEYDWRYPNCRDDEFTNRLLAKYV